MVKPASFSLPDWRSPFWLRAAELTLTVALAWQLGGLVWALWPERQGGLAIEKTASGGAPSSSVESPSKGIESTGLAAARDLFGTPETEPTPGSGSEPTSDEPIQKTDLNLTLKGILGAAGRRWAVIATGKGEEKAFVEGDTLAGGATITAIQARRVLLSRNGVTEALRLPEVEGSALATSRVQAQGPEASSAEGAIRKVSANRRKVDRDYVNSRLQDLSGLLQKAKAVPHKVGGRHQGFKIVNIQSGSVYEQLGLKEGDVIKSVNGRDIRSPDEAMQAYKELRSQDRFRVRVQRDGQSATLQFSVE